VGAALVNISENTSAADDGDAAGATRKGANCLQSLGENGAWMLMQRNMRSR
jgi:hypothetical protein